MIYHLANLTPVDLHMPKDSTTCNPWGLYQISANCYLYNCLHGGTDGSIAREDDQGDRIQTTPSLFREWLSDAHGLVDTDVVIISPCHPKQVSERWRDDLAKNNLIILDSSYDEVTLDVIWAKKDFNNAEEHHGDEIFFGRASEIEALNKPNKSGVTGVFYYEIYKTSFPVIIDAQTKRAWSEWGNGWKRLV